MNYRSLLLHLDSDPLCAERIDFAIRLARQHDCHLVGVAPAGSPHHAVAPRHAAPQSDLMALARGDLRYRAEAAASRFRDACNSANFKSFEIVVDEQDDAASLIKHLQYSDLAILSRERPEASGPTVAATLAERILMASARPTLVVPCAGRFESLTKSALVAWDDSSQTARAVLDALPLLRKSEDVQVVAWRESADGGGEAMHRRLAALQKWLLWHGVVSDVRTESTAMPIDEALLSRASDLGSGLIVMGACGHARASERILHGATRDATRPMTVPVLMSH